VPTVPASTTTTITADPAGSVLLLGDSTMADASPALRAMFEATGARVEVAAGAGFGLTGLGISALPSEFREEWARMVRDEEPDLAVVMLGFWDQAFIEREGVSAYAAVVEETVDILTADGARVLWLSVPPGGPHPEWYQDGAFETVAATRPGQVFYADIEGSQRGPAGDHPVAYVAADGTKRHLRKADGWHFCQDGAEQVARFVNEVAVVHGLTVPAPDGWQQGPWRGSAYFDEPACRS
jgi:hypothetical protein